MIFCIEKKCKKEYLNSAKSNGIRYKFYGDFDEENKKNIKFHIFY